MVYNLGLSRADWQAHRKSQGHQVFTTSQCIRPSSSSVCPWNSVGQAFLDQGSGDLEGPGEVRQGRTGKVRQGMAWIGRTMTRRGKAGEAWGGATCRVAARLETVRRGKARYGSRPVPSGIGRTHLFLEAYLGRR